MAPPQFHPNIFHVLLGNEEHCRLSGKRKGGWLTEDITFRSAVLTNPKAPRGFLLPTLLGPPQGNHDKTKPQIRNSVQKLSYGDNPNSATPT